MIIATIILTLLLLIAGFAIRNLIRKNEILEEPIKEKRLVAQGNKNFWETIVKTYFVIIWNSFFIFELAIISFKYMGF